MVPSHRHGRATPRASPRGEGGDEWAARHKIPSFVTLNADGPDSLNMPLSQRYQPLPRAGALPAKLPERSDFKFSEAALSRLLAPTAKSVGGPSSSLPVVEELTAVARARLSSADVLLLRDRLTQILEEHSGAGATAVQAARVARQYEASLRANRPISVRELCLAFPQWPSAVQGNFMQSIFRMGQLPFTEHMGSGVPQPVSARGDIGGSGIPPLAPFTPLASTLTPSHLGGAFDGVQGSMLQPLGLALPALRPKPTTATVRTPGPPSAGSGALSARERTKTRSPPPGAGITAPAAAQVRPSSLHAPKLAAMGAGLV